LKPGDTEIPNNHGAHKVVGKRDGVQTAGAQLLLRFTTLFLEIIRQLKIVSITQS